MKRQRSILRADQEALHFPFPSHRLSGKKGHPHLPAGRSGPQLPVPSRCLSDSLFLFAYQNRHQGSPFSPVESERNRLLGKFFLITRSASSRSSSMPSAS